MGVERIGWAVARGGNALTGYWTEDFFSKPLFFLDPQRQARRTLGVALAADRATLPWLLDLMRRWQSSGSTPPTLLDLASETPGHGTNTRMLINLSGHRAGEAGQARLADYGTDGGIAAEVHIDQLIGGLCPENPELDWTYDGNRARVEDSRRNREPLPMGAVQYGFDSVLWARPADFARRCGEFEQYAPVEAVRRAICLGVQRRLRRQLIETCPANLEEVVAWVLGRREAVAMMDELFPDTAARFMKSVPFEAARVRNARLFTSKNRSVDLKVWYPPEGRPDARAQRAYKRMNWLSWMCAPAESAAIVDMALAPASEALLNGLIFPR